jgi:hypothetical protein
MDKNATELGITNIGRLLEYTYNVDDNLNTYILCCSAFNDKEVFIDFKGNPAPVFALMNAIITELAEKFNMTTLKVIELIKDGQIEYDTFNEGLNGR